MNSIQNLSIKIVLSLCFILLVVISFDFQSKNIVDSKVLTNQYFSSTEKLSTPRGLFIDANGVILVENKKVYDVYFSYFNQNELNALTGYASDHSLKFNEDPELNKKVWLFKNLNENQLKELETLEINNLEIKKNYTRVYKFPDSFAHILGYTGEVSTEDLDNGYKIGDYIGKYKLERQLESSLKGSRGEQSSSVDNEYFQNPIPGNNVFLTIESDWQNKLYDLLQSYSDQQNAAGGAAVVIESKTGEVKALVSYPSFNANEFTVGVSASKLDNLAKSRGKPLLDKAISQSFTPGSIFKVITGYSLLTSKVIDRNSSVYSNSCMSIGNSSICEFGRLFYGYLNVISAYAKSSNIFFCTYALKQSEDIGDDQITKFGKQFGLGTKTGIDLEGEVTGNIDSPEYKQQNYGEAWFPGDTCNLAIGQGGTVVTPIQMAMVNMILENNGEIIQPYLIKEIKTFDNQQVLRNTKIVKNRFELDQTSKAIIDEGLSAVAYSYESAVSGFLSQFRENNLKVKTGTAETFENIDGVFIDRTQGWITGRFDYDGKNYSFAFFLQYGQGGYYVAPMLRDFLIYLNGKN
jgi:penicillin-binding protein 2